MKIKHIMETTAGATSSASVSSVAMPIGEIKSRNKPEKAPKVKKGKKYVNTISEGQMKKIATDMEELTDKEFKEKYKKSKEDMRKGLQEDEILEQDLIILPGMRRMKDTSFIPHKADRRDHEVEMARSDLYAAAKDAMRIFNLLKNRSEDQGLMGWQQSYITLAADYLNSVADSIEYKAQVSEMTGGNSARTARGAGLGESEDREYELETAIKQALQITNLIKYDDTTTDIIVKMQTLADKYKIDNRYLKDKINDVIEAKNRLESVVFNLVEPFENALNNEKTKDNNFEEGVEESKYRGIPTSVQNIFDNIILLKNNAKMAELRGRFREREQIRNKIQELEDKLLEMPKGEFYIKWLRDWQKDADMDGK